MKCEAKTFTLDLHFDPSGLVTGVLREYPGMIWHGETEREVLSKFAPAYFAFLDATCGAPA